MANRNRLPMGGRRQDMGRSSDYGRSSDFGRGGSDFGRSGSGGRPAVSPWQPSSVQVPLASTEAALTLINSLLGMQQVRPSVPSLLDLPLQQSYNQRYENRPSGHYGDRNFSGNRMGNNQNFRRGNVGRSSMDSGKNLGQRRPQQSSGRSNSNSRSRQESGKDGKKISKPSGKSTPKKDQQKKDKKENKEENSDGKQDTDAEPMEQSEVKDDSAEQDGDTSQQNESVADEQKKSGDRKQGEKRKNKFDEISPSLLVCHICNKSMWDGRSFENHINGRAHSLMMDKVAESYSLNADMMRQEQRFREAKRLRRTGNSPGDFYCAMCDINAEDGPSHRTTPAHRKLKRYLHPACTICHKEMATRIELDQHKLSHEHLVNLQADKPIKAEVVTISTLAVEEHYIEQERKKRQSKSGDEVKVPDDTNCILEYTEGDYTEINKEQIPAYYTERGVGTGFIETFSCFKCSLCDKLLETQEAADAHTRTWKHYSNFTHKLHKIAKQKRAAEDKAEDGETKRAKIDENGEDIGETNEEEATGEMEEEAGEEFEGENMEEGTEQAADDTTEAHDQSAEWDESWNSDLDEVLKCVKNDNAADAVEENNEEEEAALEPEPEPEPEPVKKQPTAKFSRGRGRGRGRGGKA